MDCESDPIYSAIGKFMVNWSVIEYELYHLAKIIYANCQCNLIPKKFPDGIAGKIKLVERALAEEPRLSEIALDGLKLTKDIWGHLDLRHLIVHGSIAHIEDPSTVTFFRPLEIKEGPLKRAERVPVELSQIEKHAQAYGEAVDVMTLIPHMLEAFMAGDRGFRRKDRSLGASGKSSS